MIEFIVAVDPRPNTKARHFVSVAQALDRGLVRPCCHARKRDRFSAHRKPQKVLDRLGLLRHVAPPFTHFFPRRAEIFSIPSELVCALDTRGWWRAVRFLDPCIRMRLPRCDSAPSSQS